MTSNLKPELSKKNKYWIDKNRYYELKYFCLQYPLWKKEYEELDGYYGRPIGAEVYSRLNEVNDPTSKTVETKSIYFNRMFLLERTAIDADPYLASYILKGVTEGHSYNYLKSRLGIPCGRDMYYDRYRRFFWLLSKSKENYI